MFFALGNLRGTLGEPLGKIVSFKSLPRAPGSSLLSLQILIKNNQEITSESSGSTFLPFPYCFLLKTIRKSLLRAPDPPAGPFQYIFCLGDRFGEPLGMLRGCCAPRKSREMNFMNAVVLEDKGVS